MTGACTAHDIEPTPQAPVAKRVPQKLMLHGDERVDEYYWLNRREDPAVSAYLEAENAYTKRRMAHVEGLRQKLYEEMRGRIKEDDETAPVRIDDYYYYRRYKAGNEYPIYCRKHKTLSAPEEVLLDVNELAAGRAYFNLRGFTVSPDHGMAAFAIDERGRRIYTLRFKDLRTGRLLEEQISGVSGNQEWANDNRTLFFAALDPQTLRWDRIFRHTLGDDDDELVYAETDDTYSVQVSKSKSERFLFISAESTVATEYRFLPADEPGSRPRLVLARERDHEYYLEDGGDRFFVLTNWKARNFRVMETPHEQTGRAHWKEVVPHREDVLVEALEAFEHHLVLEETRAGLTQMQVIDRRTGETRYVGFDEPTYAAYTQDNYDYRSEWLRYGYESLTTPDSVYDYHLRSGERRLVKRDEIPGGFDPALYGAERLFVAARDGARIPVSLVYRKSMRRDGGQPLLLYAYGAYGISSDPTFDTRRLSLLDRGFIFAIAHVRGGSEMGRAWYEDGKLGEKMNTFTDFIDVSEFLIARGYTSPRHLYAYGGSAGGLLIGAVINLRPELYHGAIAAVPFVDLVTTMLDDSIPLTTGEYDEWGNPHEPDAYARMLSYSPYDNVTAQAYPNLLVTTGLHDSQVQYWEPAKWVARLRARKTDDNALLLRTNMEAGHRGASGRFRRLEESAFDYSFLLDLESLAG